MLGTHIPMSWETNEFGLWSTISISWIGALGDVAVELNTLISDVEWSNSSPRRLLLLRKTYWGLKVAVLGSASRFCEGEIRYHEFRSRHPSTASNIPAPRLCCKSPHDKSEVSPLICFRALHSDTRAPGCDSFTST